MARNEFILAGIILAIAGVGLFIVGYNKIQTTPMEKLAMFAEEMSGQKGLSKAAKTPKTEGWVFIMVGVFCFGGGVALIARSASADAPRVEGNAGPVHRNPVSGPTRTCPACGKRYPRQDAPKFCEGCGEMLD